MDRSAKGGLFGKSRKYRTDYELGVSGADVTGREAVSSFKRRALFKGTSTTLEFRELNTQLKTSLEKLKEVVTEALVGAGGIVGQDLLSNLETFTRQFKGSQAEMSDFLLLTTRDMFVEAFKSVGDPTVTNALKESLDEQIVAITEELSAVSVAIENEAAAIHARGAIVGRNTRDEYRDLIIQAGSLSDQLEPLVKRSGELSDQLTPLQAAMDNIDFSDMEKAIQDVAFAVAFASGKLFELDERTDALIAIDALNISFDELAKKAKTLGFELTTLEESRTKRLLRLTTGFNEDITNQILKIVDPEAFALQEFAKIAEDRLANARDLGANILEVERLNALQRAGIIEKFAVDFDTSIVDALREVTDFVAGMDLSQFSTLTPTQRLETAEAQFTAGLEKAGTGNIEAINALPTIAEALLTEGRAFFGATEGFQTIFDRVEESLGGLVLNQADPIIAQMQDDSVQAFENSQMIVDTLNEMKQEIINLRNDNAALADTLTRVLAA